jgi:hypothetical protein
MNATAKVPEGQLRDYQIEDLAFLLREKRCGILHDPGGGKTPPVCVFMHYLWFNLGQKTLWPQPVSLIEKNYDELLLFTGFREEDLCILPPSGVFQSQDLNFLARIKFEGRQDIKQKRTRNRLEKLEQAGWIDGVYSQNVTPIGMDALRSAKLPKNFQTAKVILLSFEGLTVNWPMLLGFHPDITAVVGDEWHLGYAGHDSQRTIELNKCMDTIERRHPGESRLVAMTGSLIKGRLDTAYPLIRLIEPRYYFNHDDFVTYHGIFDADGKRIGWDNHARLGQIFLRHTIRRSFESIFGKVDAVPQVEMVSMSDDHRKLYDKFEAEAVLELEDKFLDGTLPGVKAIRARQILACPELFDLKPVLGKDERLKVWLDTHKQDGTPLVIYGVFNEELRRIYRLCTEAGLRTGFINGTVTGPKRGQVDRDFRAGKLDVVVASADTAGIGFNWAHCDHCIFYSLNYKDDSFIQAVRRFIRGKRTRPLLITCLQYKNTIEQRIYSIVQAKSREAHKVDGTYQTITFERQNAEEPVAETPAKKKSFSLADF